MNKFQDALLSVLVQPYTNINIFNFSYYKAIECGFNEGNHVGRGKKHCKKRVKNAVKQNFLLSP